MSTSNSNGSWFELRTQRNSEVKWKEKQKKGKEKAPEDDEYPIDMDDLRTQKL